MTQPVDFTPALLSWRMALDEARAKVASANIANVNTTGYEPQRIDFQGQLSALQTAAESGSLGNALDVVHAEGFSTVSQPADSLLGGQVNLDQEVTNLVTASTDYQSVLESLNRYFMLLHLAITAQE